MVPPALDAASPRPTLAIVSGRPGAGKSTLAHRLSKTLSCPIVSRDEIYEGMLRTLGSGTKPEAAKLSFDTFFRNLALLVSSNVSHVAEAAYQDTNWRIGIEPLLHQADVRVIRCVIDTETARDRVVRRRKDEGLSEPDLTPGSPVVRPFEQLSLPVPTLDVSTAPTCTTPRSRRSSPSLNRDKRTAPPHP